MLKRFFEIIEDTILIFKKEFELAKNSVNYSLKKFGIGLSYLISSFFLINIALLFLLISLTFGLSYLGLTTWLSFLLVALIIVGLSIIFVLLGFRSIKKMRDISGSLRIIKETKKYLAENMENK